MLQLDVMLKFWELLFALGTTLLMVVGAAWIVMRVKRRRTRLPFYVEAGGVILSVGEERFLELLAQAGAQNQNLTVIARVLGVTEITAYSAARLLKEKGLIIEVVNLESGSPRFELAPPGNDAALARGYIRLL